MLWYPSLTVIGLNRLLATPPPHTDSRRVDWTSNDQLSTLSAVISVYSPTIIPQTAVSAHHYKQDVITRDLQSDVGHARTRLWQQTTKVIMTDWLSWGPAWHKMFFPANLSAYYCKTKSNTIKATHASVTKYTYYKFTEQAQKTKPRFGSLLRPPAWKFLRK